MNEHEAQRIANAMHQLRPDWPAASVLTLIRKSLIDRPRRDVTVALAWVACETNSHTPARVLETGPWWKAAGVEGGGAVRDSAPPGTRCTICGRANHHGDEDHDFSHPCEQDPDAVAARIAELKAELAPTAGPTDRRTLEDLAEANPELHERVQRLRDENPGLVAPAMREPVPDESEAAE